MNTIDQQMDDSRDSGMAQTKSPSFAEEWNALLQDSRKGVQRLVRTYQRQRKKEQLENHRLHAMWKWEKISWRQGYQAVAGVDEAGRGFGFTGSGCRCHSSTGF